MFLIGLLLVSIKKGSETTVKILMVRQAKIFLAKKPTVFGIESSKGTRK